MVATVLVPEDHGCYTFATRCCICCCVCPALSFVKDSKTAKQQLTERRISVMDVMAGWEAKKEKKPKNGGEGKRR